MRWILYLAAAISLLLLVRWVYQLMFGRPALTFARVSEAPPEAMDQTQEPMTE